MKKFLIFAAIVGAILYMLISPDGGGTSIKDYQGSIKSASGNVVELVSGLHVRLIGVEPNRTDVEMFIKNGFLGKSVTLIPDSKGDQEIKDPNGTVGAYVILNDTHECLNHLVVIQYPQTYRDMELSDSLGWIKKKPGPTPKPDLALYMKQRTFLIEVRTEEGSSIGTGFFINDKGLAITNWHVLPAGAEKYSTAYLYKENPDDSKIYTDKKRRIKNVLWSEDTNGMDISIFSVELEQGESVPYFDIAKQRAAVGIDCATFGNPLGYTASYSAGHISAFREQERTTRKVMMMQYEMSTNGGNSGGPVCDKYGQIIAVHEQGVKDAQGLNFGIDILQIREILDGLEFNYGGR